tara:strand:- start:119353 stop:120075 length:723 start_codon:yes stop_codon:yes gene_type:complete
MQGYEKILPNQAFNANLYANQDKPIEQSIYETVLDICDVRSPQDDFDLEVTEMHSVEEMASSPISLSFLQFLVSMRQARSILEIGTFVGVSALSMAKVMPADGRLVTVEKFDHFAGIAQRNFDNNGLADRIELVTGDAGDVLPDIVKDRQFDMVFIDGNKERYADYLAAVTGSISPGGIIVIDDALFHGDVLNTKFATEKGAGVRASLELAKSLKDWRRVLLPISNGMLLLLDQRPRDQG